MLQAILPKQKSDQFTLALLLGLGVIMLLVDLLGVGQEGFIDTFNSLVLIAFLTYAAVNAIMYGLTISNRPEARQVWLVLGVGLAFYALGEMTWLYFSLNGVEVPYPSLGDILVVIAYPLIMIALVNRNRQLGVWPSQRMTAVIVSTVLILFVLIFIFLLAPIIKDMTPDREVEMGLNVYYLLMDLALLIVTNLLGASMIRSRMGLSWNLMGIGYLFMSITDVFFIYGTWNNLYYADQGANALSIGVDVGYNLAFMMVALGVFFYKVMADVQPEHFEFTFTPRPVTPDSPTLKILPYSPEVQKLFEYMYFMVDPDRQVFFFSDNFRKLCQLVGGPAPMWGKPLHRVMSVEEAEIDQLFAEVQNNKIVARPVDLLMGDYLIPVVMQAHTIRNSTDIYLSYRLDASQVAPQERTPVETLMIDDLVKAVRGLENASSEMKESTAFFIIEVQELYTFLVRMNGFRVGQILADQFNQLASSRGANVCIRDGQVQVTQVIPTSTMADLLRLTIQVVRNLTTVEATQSMVRQLNEKMPESIIRAAQKVGLAL